MRVVGCVLGRRSSGMDGRGEGRGGRNKHLRPYIDLLKME